MLINSALQLETNHKRRAVMVLGSTGSIGQSTLEVIRRNPELFAVHTLVAGSNSALLAQQINEFEPRFACLSDLEATLPQGLSGCELLQGESAICELVRHPDIDLVVAAISGNAGVASTVAALEAGKIVALANKESLVCAGSYLAPILEKHASVIIPVDSEHSALFQALQGEHLGDVHKLIITASGGPFLKLPAADLSTVTPEQALKHPRWKMGPKITIDSATLMNKGLEVIEAFWLFGLPLEQIEVVVHPQSIVHSIVSFCDGSQIAQLSETSMLGPIAYALSYPGQRLKAIMPQLDLVRLGQLEFHELDNRRFPAIEIAKQCLREGQMAQIVYSVANEVAVRKFLAGKGKFTDIYRVVEESLSRYSSYCLPELSKLGQFITELDHEISSGVS